jgi:VWFA-related protein
MRYVVAALLLAGHLAAQTPITSAGQPPTFRSGSSELVVVPVTVTDSDERLVSDLPQQAFTVLDEGRRQEIAAFSHEDIPVSIALVIDDSGSMRERLGQVIAASLAFARWSHPEDELQVIEFNDHVRSALNRSVTAADTAALEEALKTLRPEGQTALYDALMVGMDRLERAEHQRRVLVLVSDGGDNASRATMDDVLERARRSNVTIYAIGLYDENGRDRNPGVLKQLAQATGGERFLPRSPGPLMTACERIAREIRNSYMIGYVPPDRDGRFHRLRVTVTMPGRDSLKVRTRPGYVAAAGGSTR